MKWTGLNELREKYLSFFESKGHLRLDSFPLVPNNDNSLLLINSGMAPMKKWFLGQEEPPRHRVTTCQKCIRTPDIERVGITARHGTFFEMLGNFSFQDYFKEEAIPWAWEFFTEVLEIPADRLYISVYEDDDEAYDIWTKKIGVAEDHMVRFGKEDNFWEHGSGPCGPCSEIYFDRGEEYGCHKPTCRVGCDCDRFMEVWNLVFSQFDSDGNGHYERLERPNIDTGMGLERLACVMQNVDNMFEVDTVRNILKHVEQITGKTYGQDHLTDVSIRVIGDHIRSTVFMVSDGILPSNEGRGYVLRRLLRRAARHGRMLGVKRPFLAELCDTVIKENGGAYPELVEHADYIKKTISAEEERFSRTIDAGLSILNELVDNVKEAAREGKRKILSGLDVFKLNDTFGFPLDLTKEIAAEHGIEVDEEGFRTELQKQCLFLFRIHLVMVCFFGNFLFLLLFRVGEHQVISGGVHGICHCPSVWSLLPVKDFLRRVIPVYGGKSQIRRYFRTAAGRLRGVGDFHISGLIQRHNISQGRVTDTPIVGNIRPL